MKFAIKKNFISQIIDQQENFFNKKIRFKDFYYETLFVECQQHFESNFFNILEKIQIIIIKFQNQNKNFAIIVFVLFVNVEVYQNIVEQILRHSFDFDFQKFINYKKIMISSQHDD